MPGLPTAFSPKENCESTADGDPALLTTLSRKVLYA